MTFYILTLFPEMFESVFEKSIVKRAASQKLVEITLINLRDFTEGPHKTVDDKPYGGGGGMVLKVDIVIKALESIKPKPYTILLSASGKKYTHAKAIFLSKKKSISVICGHYEGVDARVEKFVNETISIGDFVLTGGEIAAMAIVDSVTRLIPNVIKKESLESESFSNIGNLLEYPQYTRPHDFRNLKIPNVLLTGNHAKIEAWRKEQAIKRTKKLRPDLIKSKSK